MSSFTREDYRELFNLGRELYQQRPATRFTKLAAVQLMAMAESVIGQQVPWPRIAKQHMWLRKWPPEESGEVVQFRSK